MIRQLPLFPLDTILFPGATLSLHIFEERYRQMVARCLQDESPFGVVLIREGDSVLEGRVGARPAEPYGVGTMARISANVRLDDGRYLLTAVGEGRFRIQYLLQHAPYLVASVVELPEERPAAAAPLADELRHLHDRYWRGVSAATGTPVEPEELPGEPLQLAYQLADRLQIDPSRKQRWLETDLNTRLRELAAALRAELALLPRGGKERGGEGWQGSSSLN